MKKIVFIIAVITITGIHGICQNNQKVLPILKGPYLGQKSPGIKASLFAPGIICTEEHEGSSGFNINSTHLGRQKNRYWLDRSKGS